MEFFLLNVLLKVFLFLKVCDGDQVELEAMVLEYPKFYNHEYCSLVNFSLQSYVMKIEVSSVGVLEYSTCTRVQLEYHFLSTRTRNPRYSVGTRTRRSMYSVLGLKKSRVHEYIWSLLKVINKMNF